MFPALPTRYRAVRSPTANYTQIFLHIAMENGVKRVIKLDTLVRYIEHRIIGRHYSAVSYPGQSLSIGSRLVVCVPSTARVYPALYMAADCFLSIQRRGQPQPRLPDWCRWLAGQ